MRHFLISLILLVAWSGVAGAQSAAPPAVQEPYRNPTLAATKSLLLPGWGQMGNV